MAGLVVGVTRVVGGLHGRALSGTGGCRPPRSGLAPGSVPPGELQPFVDGPVPLPCGLPSASAAPATSVLTWLTPRRYARRGGPVRRSARAGRHRSQVRWMVTVVASVPGAASTVCHFRAESCMPRRHSRSPTTTRVAPVSVARATRPRADRPGQVVVVGLHRHRGLPLASAETPKSFSTSAATSPGSPGVAGSLSAHTSPPWVCPDSTDAVTRAWASCWA